MHSAGLLSLKFRDVSVVSMNMEVINVCQMGSCETHEQQQFPEKKMCRMKRNKNLKLNLSAHNIRTMERKKRTNIETRKGKVGDRV